MTTSEIAAEHGVSRQTVHAHRKRGVFPKPVVGEGSTRPRFRADEVAAFFAANPPQPGKRTDLAPAPDQGDPVTTTTARDRLAETLMSPGLVGLDTEQATEMLDAYRRDVVTEVVEALTLKAGELSALAEAEMRSDLEERAQVWHEAAEVARKLKRRRPEAQDG